MASLLELVETLVRDPAAKAAYRADPDEFLDRHGFGGLEPVDLEEALHHAADSFPPAVAAQVDPAAGFDSLVHVDLQELGFDDELRPLDPLDDDPIDAADGNGPRLGDDVDFDAPPGAGGDGEGTDGDGVHDPAVDRADPDADLDADADGDGAPAAGSDGDGDGDGDVPAGLDGGPAAEADADVNADVDAVLDPTGGDAALDGADGDGPGADGLGIDTLVDQPATADWAEDGFDRPGLGPHSDDPWFYNQDEPTFDLPEQVDDDIMDDVDDFHHDG